MNDRAGRRGTTRGLGLVLLVTMLWTGHARAVPAVDREVFGYLPYWEMGYEVARWDLLTTLAWFGVGIDASGAAASWHGWGEADTEALVTEAHAHGVRVVVTVTNFDDDSIEALVNSADARAQAVDTCLMLMSVHGADGINIDFEGVPKGAKQGFVALMTELKIAVSDAKPNGTDGHVTLAGPAVDWKGSYDYDQLLLHTDGIMIMGYGYHWSGGNPGPISPLTGGAYWPEISVTTTLDDYETWGGAENMHKVILGLPWYGRQWPVAEAAIPTSALGEGQSISFATAAAEAATHGAHWDDVAQNPYYHKDIAGTLWQVWYDDQASFGGKVALVEERGLAGIGIWALGYEGGRDDYWLEIEDQLTQGGAPPPPDAGSVDAGQGQDAVADLGSWDVGPEDESLEAADGPDAGRHSGVQVGQVVISTRTREVVQVGCTGGGRAVGPWWIVAIGVALARSCRRRRAPVGG